MIGKLWSSGDRASLSAAGIAVLSSLLYIALVAYLPVAMYSVAGHDDALFWWQAQSIVSGEWLGRFSQLTLMKGPGYSFFLALVHVVGLPLSIAQALLYTIACGLLAFAMFRVTGRVWWMLLLFLALQWHPAALAWDRVLRDNIIAAQTMLVLACLVQALFLTKSRRGAIAWPLATGLFLGWFWLTRDDGIWIVPGVVMLFAGRWLQIARDRRQIVELLRHAALVLGGFGVVLVLVASCNLAMYGKFETVDFRGSAFKGALTELQGVRVGDSVPYVPVPKKVRQAVYAHSPHFAQLQPYFEGTGRNWTEPGCAVYASSCGDYAGGWFIWALRDGAALQGHYESPEKAAAFYRAISDEVGSACSDGRLQCVRSSLDFMPGVTPAQWQTFPQRAGRVVLVLLWRDAPLPVVNSIGPADMQLAMWRFVGKPAPRLTPAGESDARVVGGWFHAGSDETWLQLRCKSAPDAPVAVKRHSSPDIAAHFNDPDATSRRFQIELPAGSDCALEQVESGDAKLLVQMNDVKQVPVHLPVGGDLYFDRVADLAGNLRADVAPWALPVRRAVGTFWQWISPLLAGAGVLAMLAVVALATRQRRVPTLLVIALATWAMVACRLLILVLVDLSAFPAFSVQYMQPAFPLLVFASVASLLAVLEGRAFASSAVGQRE